MDDTNLFFYRRIDACHSEGTPEESGLCVEGRSICRPFREGKGSRRIGQMLHEYIQHDDLGCFRSLPKKRTRPQSVLSPHMDNSPAQFTIIDILFGRKLDQSWILLENNFACVAAACN